MQVPIYSIYLWEQSKGGGAFKVRIRIRIRIFIFLHPLYTVITDFIYTIIMTLMNTIV
jgi:hypothetical protein